MKQTAKVERGNEKGAVKKLGRKKYEKELTRL